MADSNHSELVDEFCKVTGSDPVRAQQYLEAAGWDSNLATSSYFEEADEEDEEDIPAEQTKERFSSRIATLASLMNNKETPDEEEGQAFYAGGSERSGQQVLGPSKKKNFFVEEMFRAAKSHGAEVVNPSETRSSGPTKLRVFHGTGHVLGSSEGQSQTVDTQDFHARPQVSEVWLRVWRSGFTVDDEPFRAYDDPHNREFIESIKKGEMPLELKRQAEGDIQLNIEDHSLEDYVPKKEVKAFAGTGFRLGSITPPVLDLSKQTSQRNDGASGSALKVDESQPVTTIQIRLGDGSRITLTLNHTHTVGDIRRHIVSVRPEYSASVFSLMTAYPSKELKDDEATLTSENLLNAVIVQKLM